MMAQNSYKQNSKINIIGAGPAGLAAAICAAKILNSSKDFYLEENSSALIHLYEKSDRIGQTILRTGNGRCNFSNENIPKDKGRLYNNIGFFNKVYESLAEILYKQRITKKNYNTDSVHQFLQDLGLEWNTKQDGMMFPVTNKATTVLDVLRYRIKEYENLGLIKIHMNSEIDPTDTKSLNIICSGQFSKKTFKELSVTNIESYKILGPIKTETQNIKNLDGTRINTNVKLKKNDKKIFDQDGEVLFRKYGVSGIVIFNASRFLPLKISKNDNYKIILDFIPQMSLDELKANLNKRTSKVSKFSNEPINYERILAGLLLPNITTEIIKRSRIKPFAHVYDFEEDNPESPDKTFAKNQIDLIATQIKNFELEVKGIGDSKQCQVTRGGILTNEINPQSMQLTADSSTYVAGEIVDIDGPCGGYNLHWAFMSGMLAGLSAAKKLLKED